MVDAFISYSWDSDDHKEWVRNLATRLRENGVNVTLDQWHLALGDQVPEFMERAVRESDYVLIICTHRYKKRSENREGGVGYEGDIITAEVLNNQNQRKFIPILRQHSWSDSAPSWLLGKYYIDLSSTPYSETQYQDLVTTLLGTRPKAPPIGSIEKSTPLDSGTKSRPKKNEVEFEPIKILGVIVDQIGTPLGDGTPGSALYQIPFRLSSRPSSEWVDLFISSWDWPPSFTTMHRPGIASVAGDTVILDGTTIEEVEKYHRDTLILATQEANRKYQEYINKKRKKEERQQKRLTEHKKNVEEVSKKINFDDD